jgi:coenzyme PQQ precursor peptide PqqA
MLALHSGRFYPLACATVAHYSLGGTSMAWKTPKIVEVPVGMEINMYACAARK